jgi:phosphonopyruvate decarboxylase
MVEIIETLKNLKISMITGVPDSLLVELIHSIELSDLKPYVHVAPNEGNAVALAAGHYLGSGSPAIVYMQNSGLSNALNPLISFAHKKMFGIPMILIIGWRGELNEQEIQLPDEPQHMIQGFITRKQLADLEIPYHIGSKDHQIFAEQLEAAYKESFNVQSPIAILVRKGVFDNRVTKPAGSGQITSLQAVQKIVELSPKNALFVGSTGMIGRELLKSTEKHPEFDGRVILNVGAMGHVSALAKGIASANPSKAVICIDGDGSLLMHLGSLALLPNLTNFKHILLNNNSHDSVGGQRTAFFKKNHRGIYRGFSKKGYCRIKHFNNYSTMLMSRKLSSSKSCFIELLCAPRQEIIKDGKIMNDLPRPTKTPKQYEKSFRKWIE